MRLCPAQSQKAEINLSLRQNGDSLTGSMQMQDILVQIDKGTVDGDALTFSAAFPMGGKTGRGSIPGKDRGRAHTLTNRGNGCRGQPEFHPKPDAERIERLSGLFRLWGIVKFFHPYVVRGAVDWGRCPSAGDCEGGIGKGRRKNIAPLSRACFVKYKIRIRVCSAEARRRPVDPAPHQRRVLRSGYYPQFEGTGGRFYAAWEAVGPTPAYVAELPDGMRVAVRTAEPRLFASGTRESREDLREFATSERAAPAGSGAILEYYPLLLRFSREHPKLG